MSAVVYEIPAKEIEEGRPTEITMVENLKPLACLISPITFVNFIATVSIRKSYMKTRRETLLVKTCFFFAN